MSATTKIEWCDSTSLGRAKSPVLGPVARIAKGDPVAQLESQLREAGERLDVVGVKVPAPGVAAVLAGEAVTQLHIVGPALCLLGHSQAKALQPFSINVARRIGPTKRPGSDNGADLRTIFQRSRNSPLLAYEAAGTAHATPGLFGEANPLPIGPRLASVRLDRYPRARQALRRQTVVTGAVPVEKVSRTPLLALRAALLGEQPRSEVCLGHSGLTRRDLHRTIWGLCHG